MQKLRNIINKLIVEEIEKLNEGYYELVSVKKMLNKETGDLIATDMFAKYLNSKVDVIKYGTKAWNSVYLQLDKNDKTDTDYIKKRFGW